MPQAEQVCSHSLRFKMSFNVIAQNIIVFIDQVECRYDKVQQKGNIFKMSTKQLWKQQKKKKKLHPILSFSIFKF